MKKARKINLEKYLMKKCIRTHGYGYWASMKTPIIEYYKTQIKNYRSTKQLKLF